MRAPPGITSLVANAIAGREVRDGPRVLIDDLPGLGSADFDTIARAVVADGQVDRMERVALRGALASGAAAGGLERALAALSSHRGGEIPMLPLEPAAGESRTTAALRSLDLFGLGLLGAGHPDQQAALRVLADQGLTAPSPLAGTLSISFDPARWTGRIEHPRQLAALTDQVRAVAHFLRRMWVDSGGGVGLPFRTVELVPSDRFLGRMSVQLSADRLVVGVPRIGSRHRVAQAKDLRRAWDSGDMFELPRGKKGLMAKAAWRLLNPVGAVRRGLFRAAVESARNLEHRLSAIQAHAGRLPTTELRTAVVDAIDAVVRRDAPTPEGQRPLREDAKRAVTRMDRARLLALLDLWKTEASEPDALRDASEAPVAVVSRKTGAIRIKGRHVIGNYHDVDVRAAFGAAAQLSDRMAKYISVPNDLRVDVEAQGLVVYTIDRVDVDAAIGLGRVFDLQRDLLATASLDRALQRVDRLP